MARAPQSLGTLNPEPFVFVDGVGWAVFASSVLLCGCFASGFVWRDVVRLASVCLVSVVSLVAVIAVVLLLLVLLLLLLLLPLLLLLLLLIR